MRAFGVNVSPTCNLVILYQNWRKYKNSEIFHFDVHSHDVIKVSVLEPGNFIAGTNIFNETFVNSQVLKTIVTVSVSVFVIVFISVFMLVVVPIFVSSTSQVIFIESYYLCLQAELMWGSMDEEVKTTYGKSYFDQKVEQTGGQVYIQIHKYLHIYEKSYFDQKVKTGKRTNTQIYKYTSKYTYMGKTTLAKR